MKLKEENEELQLAQVAGTIHIHTLFVRTAVVHLVAPVSVI